jgi:HAE1 family hydrophobic/amphiphilic exporter-1
MEINRDKVLKAGVALSDIYTTVGAFLGGSYVNDFNRFGRLYKAYIQAEPEYRISEDQHQPVLCQKQGRVNRVPLSAFVSIKEAAGPDFTNRFNLYRAIELSGAPAPAIPRSRHWTPWKPSLPKPCPGHGLCLEQYVLSGEESLGYGGRCFGLLPAVCFPDPGGPVRKLVPAHEYPAGHALCHFRGVPGPVPGRLTSTSYELNVFAQIALVMLIGMAAKNAILIVEFANIEFNKGLSCSTLPSRRPTCVSGPS